MKQKFLLLISLVLMSVQGWAAPVDESSARTIVQGFILNTNGYSPSSVPTSSGGSDLQLLHAEMSSVSVTMNSYYIYNTGDGFVIVAGDDRAELILGYGDGELDMSDIPCGMQFMLDSYKEQIDYLFEHPGLVVETSSSLNAPKLTATSVAPMLTARWGQRKPYYNLTPVYDGSHCKTGCSCVALCQVMHKWKYPKTPVPSLPSYVSSFRGVTITVPELPSDWFHWNYIKDSYSGSYTADEAYSVAKLMRYVGQAEHMLYTPDASGAYPSNILEAAILFGYNRNAKVLRKSYYTDTQWAALIQAELIAGRPIVYGGYNSSYSVGHSFNLDGYRASDNKYHMNWGFRGNADGYYALNAFNPLNNNFNYGQDMIVGLEPQDPEIVVTPASLSLNAKTGETKMSTFTVKGYALTGNLTVKLNNGGSIYSIDKTSITMSDAAYEATVTVTYKPTVVGSSNASVTISGGGAASKTVTLKGSASAATAITTTPSSLSFSAYVGETKTETFIVKCPNAISNLKLTLNNGGSIYSIDKTSISKSAANSGTNVTVTYKPTVAGTSNASVTISGGGANPKTVNLSGTATIKPEIIPTPSTLSFSAYTGKTKTATFTVKCTNAKSDLNLTLNNSANIYSIDKTSISKSDAINGATVTVTYSPTETGASNASVTISGGGADPKTVTMSGTALEPSIITDVNVVTFDTTYTGYEGSQTIIITGTNLLNDIQLNFAHDYANSFALSKYTITPEEATAGTRVTVYFHPMSGGTKHATLNIKSDGVETITIPVNGTAIKSDGFITAWPEELSFETQVGTSVTKTFKVTYSKNDDDNGFIMINCTDNDGETDSNDEGESDDCLPKLKSSKRISDLIWTRTDSIFWSKKIVIIDPIFILDCIWLRINVTGDDCFNLPQYGFGSIRLYRNGPNSNTYSTTLKVTYHPDAVGENEAFIKISYAGSVKSFILPLHGTATAQLNAPSYDNDGNDLIITQRESSTNTLVDEMLMNIKVYTDGQMIIIESPVEQSAVISDIAGHAMSVNLQAGRNEIPVNASGIYIVRIREKTTKLVIR